MGCQQCRYRILWNKRPLQINARFVLTPRVHTDLDNKRPVWINRPCTRGYTRGASRSTRASEEKHKAYDVKFKLKAVEVARRKNISTAAREFKVDRKRVRQWMIQESDLPFCNVNYMTRVGPSRFNAHVRIVYEQ